MTCKCKVCGIAFEYSETKGYDKALCSSFCDGKDGVIRAIEPLRTRRNDFEGPSLDYMQGYRDGQQFLQNELAVILRAIQPGRDS